MTEGHRPRWQAKAACHGLTDLFFAPAGAVGRAAVQEARQICAGCPVKAECLAWAIELRIPDGVFGGATIRERRRLAPELGRRVAECGTPSGYRVHRKNSEPACDACLSAHKVRQAEYSRRASFSGHDGRFKVRSW